MRGTHNLSSLLDSKVLLPITEAALLIVTDATRSNLQKEWRAVLDAPADKRGTRLHKAHTRLEKERAFTDEERRIWHMLESAVQTELASRVHLFGLLHDDVIEYLPAAAVTGTAGASWGQLKREWRANRQQHERFKDWLRRAGVDVSTVRLMSLAADLPAPKEFQELALALYAAGEPS